MSQVIPSPRSDISVIEVSPRDGLQNEKIPLTVDQRTDLIHQLAAAGAKRIETVAFVHPTRVPQMANLHLGPCDARTRPVHDASTTEARGKYFHRLSTTVLLKYELAYIHRLDVPARPLNNFARCCAWRVCQ